MHSPTKHLLLLASLASLAATQDYEAEYEEDPNAIEGLPASAADLLDAPYDYGFNCDQQDAGYGYYADVNNGCKVFHICVPIYDNEGALDRMDKYSFVCGEGTVNNGCKVFHICVPIYDNEGT